MSNVRDLSSGKSGKSASGKSGPPGKPSTHSGQPPTDRKTAAGDDPKTAAGDDEKPAEMGNTSKTLIGVWIMALSAVALGHLVWAWSLAAQTASAKLPVHAHWFGIEFAPQKSSVMLIVVVLTAVIGSAATMALTFADRSGYRKLEKGWEWWYITRPLTAASIGVLAFALLQAGFFGNGTSNTSDLLAAAVTGGLAGLFTDQLLQKMRAALGLSAFGESANAKTAKIQSNATSPDWNKDGN